MTVLFTDLADYTASVRRSDRQGIRHLIVAHESQVASVLESHGGRVVKNMGDSFMALFGAATDAVRAGLALSQSLESSEMLKLRVAMATGDVEEISNDFFGDAVNLASRILLVTPVRQVWFSHSTMLSLNQVEIPHESVGLFTFKGFFGEAQVFRVVGEGQAFLPEPVASVI
jgi:class 3 adenylate cyclase